MRIGSLVTSSALCLIVGLAGAWTQAAQPKTPPKAQTATQFYVQYRAAFDKATKIEDIAPYLSEKNRKQMMDTPKEDRDKMFGVMKIMNTFTNFKVLKEERQADGSAILSCEGVDSDKKKNTGKVTIVKENGAWKLGDESWSS